MQIKCYKKKKNTVSSDSESESFINFVALAKLRITLRQTVSIQYFSLENFRA